MKKIILFFAAIVMVAGFSNTVVAQTTANVDNNATATIIAPIGITAGADLAFGNIIKGAGDVTVDVNGTRTISASMKPGNQNGTITAGVFNVSGEAAYTYTITLPANDVVTITDGSDPMDVNDFNCFTATDNDAGVSGTLNGSGTDVITVGATLTVAADQATGAYTGTFNVTVAYN